MHKAEECPRADGHSQLVGQASAALCRCSKGNRGQLGGEAAGPSSIGRQGWTKAFGEGLAPTVREVTEEAARLQTEDERKAGPRQVSDGAGITAVDS